MVKSVKYRVGVLRHVEISFNSHVKNVNRRDNFELQFCDCIFDFWGSIRVTAAITR